MKYLSTKKTVVLLAVNVLITAFIWLLPSILENMLLQKIVVISLTFIAVVLTFLFLMVNGMTTTLIEGAYEKEYYSHLKAGRALDEGQNLRYNPFKLTLCRRIYYAKLLILYIFPIVLAYLFECGVILIEMIRG